MGNNSTTKKMRQIKARNKKKARAKAHAETITKARNS